LKKHITTADLLICLYKITQKPYRISKKTVEINTNFTNAYYDLGLAYSHLKNYSKAIPNYTKAIEIDTGYAKAYYNRGLVYKIIQEYSKAISDFTKTIEINPNFLDAYLNRGNAYYDSGNTTNACEDWSKAYSLGITEAKDLLYKYCK